MNGSGCKTCPVQNCDTFNYRGSRCAALRDQYGLGDPKTYLEHIRTMTEQEMVNFIKEIAYQRKTPWSELFEKTFCKNCPTVEGTIVETGQKMAFHECDFTDSECPHGDEIAWWLQQPVDNK